MKTNQPTQFSAERIKSNETNSWKRTNRHTFSIKLTITLI